MNPRGAAGILLALAAVCYLGVVVPLRARAAAARAEFRMAGDQRRQTRVRLDSLERRRAARERAAILLAAARNAGGDAAAFARGAVVGALRDVRVSNVRLTVRPGRPPAGALVSLSAQGPFAEVMRLCANLARPENGLILERVQIMARSAGLLVLQVQATGALQQAR